MTGVSWFAIRVAPNSEFKVMHAINQRDRPAILPFEEKWVRNARNKPRPRKFALFPSYVFGGFVGGTLFEAWLDFAETRRIVNKAAELAGKAPPIIGAVGYGQTPATLSGDEISWLQTLSRAAGPEPGKEVLSVGQTVEIFNTGTPYDHTNAKITRIARSRVAVMLRMFNTYIEVEMQQNNVRAA